MQLQLEEKHAAATAYTCQLTFAAPERDLGNIAAYQDAEYKLSEGRGKGLWNQWSEEWPDKPPKNPNHPKGKGEKGEKGEEEQ